LHPNSLGPFRSARHFRVPIFLTIRQVFWLSDPPTLRTFPSRTRQDSGFCGFRPRLQRRDRSRVSRNSLLGLSAPGSHQETIEVLIAKQTKGVNRFILVPLQSGSNIVKTRQGSSIADRLIILKGKGGTSAGIADRAILQNEGLLQAAGLQQRFVLEDIPGGPVGRNTSRLENDGARAQIQDHVEIMSR